MDKRGLVKKIIKNNTYLSLSTCDGKTPWVAPVEYVVDDNYNFYFISALESLHGQHILRNSNVAFSIFDSRQQSGKGEGIQVSGKASLLKKPGYPEAVTRYLSKLKRLPINLGKYAVFKIKPAKFYIPDSEAWKKEGVDKRTEVKMMQSFVEEEPEAKKEYLKKLERIRKQKTIPIGSLEDFRKRYGIE